jgi:hypothetical protein
MQVHTAALLQPWGMVVYVDGTSNTAEPHDRMLQVTSAKQQQSHHNRNAK